MTKLDLRVNEWSKRLGRLLLLLSVCLSGVMLGGCSSTKAPSLRVIDATVTERSGEAAVVSFLIELDNPNDQPLQLREFSYSVSIDGQTVFSAKRSAEATLPQHSTQQMFLPGVVPFARLSGGAGGVRACLLSGHVSYTAPGQLAEILFDAELRVPKAGFGGAQNIELLSP